MRNRAEIKYEAKGIMRTAQVSPYVMTLLLLAIVFLLDRLVDLVQGGSLFYSYTSNWEYYQILMSGDAFSLESYLASMPESSTLFVPILVSLFTIVLNAGYYVYCMGIRQGAQMPYATLADGLGMAGKLIWCGVQVYARVFLWSLLFVVPGIVASYRYRFAYYNLLTDSSLSAGDAIRLSCQQTMGMKGALFVLDLSFVGWAILSSATLGLLNIWLTPYMTLCDLAYFEDAQRNLGRSPYGNGQNSAAGRDPWEST